MISKQPEASDNRADVLAEGSLPAEDDIVDAALMND
jgi:hypothetical protein